MMIAKVEVVYLFFSSTFFSIFFNSSCFFGTGLACSDHLDRNHPDGSQENNPQVQCRGNSGGRGLGVGFGHEISSIQGWFDYCTINYPQSVEHQIYLNMPSLE